MMVKVVSLILNGPMVTELDQQRDLPVSTQVNKTDKTIMPLNTNVMSPTTRVCSTLYSAV